MRSGHLLPPSTRTVELAQLAEISAALDDPAGKGVTAQSLGVSDDSVPASALLVALTADGPPEYPYLHGRFAVGPGGPVVVVDLHTPALVALSRHLHLHHSWGT